MEKKKKKKTKQKWNPAADEASTAQVQSHGAGRRRPARSTPPVDTEDTLFF